MEVGGGAHGSAFVFADGGHGSLDSTKRFGDLVLNRVRVGGYFGRLGVGR
jgi:hypothetical protein